MHYYASGGGSVWLQRSSDGTLVRIRRGDGGCAERKGRGASDAPNKGPRDGATMDDERVNLGTKFHKLC